MNIFEFSDIIKNDNTEPNPDIIICGVCHKKYKIEDCIAYEDGDWENGYYTFHVCPECEDGGEPEYTYSEKQALKHDEWVRKTLKGVKKR